MPKPSWWFRLDITLDQHPKLGRLADLMGVCHERALARLVRFWMGVREHAADGDVSELSDTTIAAWMRAPAGREKKWVDALRGAGLIVNGVVYGWWERQGGVIKEVDKARERMRAKRGNSPEPRSPNGSPNGSANIRPHHAEPFSDKTPPTRVLHPHQSFSSGTEKDLGAAAPAPKEAKPKKPADPRNAELRSAFEFAYLERFGAPHITTDPKRVNGQIAGALKTIGGDDPVGTLRPLFEAYFDLADRDQFYAGAPLEKFLAGGTLMKLRAAVKHAPQQGAPPKDPDAQRFLAIKAALFAIHRDRLGLKWSVPFILDGKPMDVSGQLDCQSFSWFGPDESGKTISRSGEVDVVFHKRSIADGISIADIPAWVGRNLQPAEGKRAHGAA